MRDFVVGIGNALLRDEGVGCHVVEALDGLSLPDVEVMDAGTSPMLPDLVDAADRLIVVDAADGGGEPGEIYRFGLEDVELVEKPLLSVHDLGLLENLKLMKLLGQARDVVVIGVQPKETTWGLELSPELESRMPRIVAVVLEELDKERNLKGEVRC